MSIMSRVRFRHKNYFYSHNFRLKQMCFSLLLFSENRIVHSFASSIICNRVPGLTPVQRQLCTEAPDAFIALGDGHMLGAQECQHQFKGRCYAFPSHTPTSCAGGVNLTESVAFLSNFQVIGGIVHKFGKKMFFLTS